MNELQVINKQEILGKKFKMYGTIEEPLFLAKDVAEWIDYSVSNVSKMLDKVDDDEKTTHTISTNGNYKTEAWFLTEDGLYEVLMQSRKPVAKQFKKKVKEILKGLRKKELELHKPSYMIDDPIKRAEQWIIEQKEKQQLLEKIEDDKPKVEFAESVSLSKDCIDVGQMAKVLNDNGIDMGRNKLFKWLRDNKYLMKTNEPYQCHIKNGLFKAVEYTYTVGSHIRIAIKPVITSKGQLHIVKKLKKSD